MWSICTVMQGSVFDKIRNNLHNMFSIPIDLMFVAFDRICTENVTCLNATFREEIL